MNTELKQFMESFEKNIRSSAFNANRKQKNKIDKFIGCWVFNQLSWSKRRIGRLLNLSHHTVAEYILIADELFNLNEITCEDNPSYKTIHFDHEIIEMIEGNDETNPSHAKKTIGARHNYDEQNDDY